MLVALIALLAGFRSVHGVVGGARALGWSLFGPSDEMARRFQDVEGAWRRIEEAAAAPGSPDPVPERRAQRVLERWPHLRRQQEAWQAFRKAWEDGQYDPGRLAGAEADARVALAYVREANPGDPRYAKVSEPKGGDVEAATWTLRQGASIDRGAREATAAAADLAREGVQVVGELPWQVKVGAAAGAAAVVFALYQYGKIVAGGYALRWDG